MNLPQQTTSFVGRTLEIAKVRENLLSGRLLTLVGPGGCGKTRLALAVAHDLLAQFSDRVWWVDLAPSGDATLLPQLVASALGLSEQPGRTLTEAIIEFVQPARGLLVLDNCEHLGAACAAMASDLLPACPQLHILATSREPLAVTSERTWLVPPLSLPPKNDPLAVGELTQYGAVALLVERAATTMPGFALTEQNARAAVELCRRLDGLPLAIELAAARVKMLTLTQIVAHLDEVLTLLVRGHPLEAPRHQSLRAAMDWSYELLSQPDRALFQRLSVFAGSFTWESVSAICSAPPLSADQVLDRLASLLDKSLMLVADREEGRPARYRLLETIRHYAREKSVQAGETEELRDRHLAYFCQVAEIAEQKLRGAEQMLWLKRLDLEHDDLRAALAWALDAGPTGLGLRLAGALSRFWDVRGYWSEGQRWLVDLLASDMDSAGKLQSEASRQWRIKALYGAGMQALYKYDMSAARARLQESLQQAQALEDPWWMALSLNALNGTYIFNGTLAAAQPALEESVALARSTGDQWLLALCLAYLGHAVRLQEYDSAAPILEESLRLAREAGDQITLCEVLFIAANAELTWQKLARATELSQELIQVSRQVGRKMYEALGLYLQAGVLFLEGQTAAALRLIRDGLTLAREAEEPQTMALGLGAMAIVVTALGQAEHAARWFGAAEAVLQGVGIELAEWASDGTSFGDRYLEAMARARANLGEVAFAEAVRAGRATSSRLAMDEALAVAEQVLGQAQWVSRVEGQQPTGLAITALGAAQVRRGDQLLSSSDWVFAKARDLFFYLLCHPPATKEEIGLVFWPEASPAQLRRAFHRALHEARQSLGPADWIRFDDGRYTFNRSRPCAFDVETFEAGLSRAYGLREQQPDAAVQQFERAVQLYHGDFLPGAEAHEWVLLRREALLALGQGLAARGAYARAIDVYRQAIDQDSYLEAAHRELMRAYAQQGEPSQAVRHCHWLADLMRTELRAQPSAETTRLYEQLRTGGKV